MVAWLPVAIPRAVEVRVDGLVATDVDVERVGGGTRVQLAIGGAPHRVEIRARRVEDDAVFAFEIVEASRPPVLSPEADEAVLRAAADVARGLDRAHLLHELARRRLRAGNADAAIAHLVEAGPLAAASGHSAAAARSAMLEAYLHMNRRALDRARDAMRGAPATDPIDAATAVLRAYHDAIIARAAGDQRGALRHYDAAAALADRVACRCSSACATSGP